MKRALVASALVSVLATQAHAWPVNLTQCLLRDARRIVPRSLGTLLLEREDQILDEARRFPPELGHAMAADLAAGTLQPETLAALEAHAGAPIDLIRQKRVSEGIVAMGALLRIPADLSDPVLTCGPEGYAPGVVREYYAFIDANLDKIPVVLDDAPALKLDRKDLKGYWQGLLARSRSYSPVIGIELFQQGRVVSHNAIDYRSPVFGVASLAYSRAVTSIAATWLALWREVKGDVTRQPAPTVVTPHDAPPEAAGDPVPRPAPSPRPPQEARRP